MWIRTFHVKAGSLREAMCANEVPRIWSTRQGCTCVAVTATTQVEGIYKVEAEYTGIMPKWMRRRYRYLSKSMYHFRRFQWIAARVWHLRSWLVKRGYSPENLRGKTGRQLADMYYEALR